MFSKSVENNVLIKITANNMKENLFFYIFIKITLEKHEKLINYEIKKLDLKKKIKRSIKTPIFLIFIMIKELLMM